MELNVVEIARNVLTVEAEAILAMRDKLGDGSLERAAELLLRTKGRVVLTGMGKSGLIARKIAATMASTGTQTFFMHPAEAYHGDLGMIGKSDAVIALSYSGETEELIRLVPFLVDRSIPLIALTRNPTSTLGSHAAVHLDASVAHEACPFELTPTASTTAALALGDALAMVLMQKRNFSPEDFAEYHPGGNLGRRLLSRVKDVMRTEGLPCATLDTSLVDLLHIVSSGRLGTCIINEGEATVGIVTDGDLRRVLEKQGKESFDLVAEQIMTHRPAAIDPNERLEIAVRLMNERNITVLLVAEKEKTVGILQLFDCGI